MSHHLQYLHSPATALYHDQLDKTIKKNDLVVNNISIGIKLVLSHIHSTLEIVYFLEVFGIVELIYG